MSPETSLPPPIPAVWHVGIGGQQQGPFMIDQIAAKIDDGSIRPSSLVWRKGMGEWRKAEETEEIKALFRRSSPALAAGLKSFKSAVSGAVGAVASAAGNRDLAAGPGVIDIGRYRHHSETAYFVPLMIAAGAVWLVVLVIVAVSFPFSLILLGFALFFWVLPMALSHQFFRAAVLGNCVRLGPRQYGEFYALAQEIAAKLGLKKMPEIFLVAQGSINAIAIRFFSSNYVILYSSLVDLMLSRGQMTELKMIMGHELAHHAAGHTSFWKSLFLMPAKRFLPYFGPAYSRACELTADRVGMVLTGDPESAKRALLYLACGSERLGPSLNAQAFIEQEGDIPDVFGFMLEAWSTHPRTTKRVQALASFENAPRV